MGRPSAHWRARGGDSRQALVAVIGNPNSGKTTLFNALTGSHQRIGNWPGVTVERKEGTVVLESPAAGPQEAGHRCREVRLVDLPGIYSLAASSDDEAIARDFILDGAPDLVIDVVDAANIQRNFFLTLQLLEMRVPVLVVLNMMDLARRKGMAIDPERLSRELDCPVVALSATRRGEVGEVRRALRQALGCPRASRCRVRYPQEVECVLEGWRPRLACAAPGADARWSALRLLEGDPWVEARAARARSVSVAEVEEARAAVRSALGDDPDVLVADARYGLIQELCGREGGVRGPGLSARVDRLVLDRILALPIFLAVMYLTFWFTMKVGGAFIDFFDILGGALFVDGPAALLASAAAPAWVVSLLAGGIGSGLRAVVTFVPVIAAMFLALAVLEDSGYMARAAFVMDRLMRSIGLPGKGFVPMMVGFGCTVPAVMGTRTLESRRERCVAVFMAPDMSCGARLPVYVFFAAAFFASHAGAVVFSLYAIGIAVALATGLLLKSTLFRGETSPFVMELPPYHAPRPDQVARQALLRVKDFIVRAGLTITLAAALLGVANSLGVDGRLGSGGRRDSVLAAAGRLIAPGFAPMGIEGGNWPAAVGLLTGMFAKETVVGTLSSLYGQAGAAGGAAGFDAPTALREALASVPAGLRGAGSGILDPLGAARSGADAGVLALMRGRFSPQAAYAYLLFVLLYFPCVATLGAAIKEVGRGLAWLMAAYHTVVAWSVATLFYQLSAGGNLLLAASALGALAAVAALFAAAGRLRRPAPAAGAA